MFNFDPNFLSDKKINEEKNIEIMTESPIS